MNKTNNLNNLEDKIIREVGKNLSDIYPYGVPGIKRKKTLDMKKTKRDPKYDIEGILQLRNKPKKFSKALINEFKKKG